MNSVFSSSDKIGDIVARFPKAGEIFTKYGIDFCCGGHRSLSEAIQEKGLEEKKVLERLEKGYQDTIGQALTDIDWRQAPSNSLIDHILNTHHVFLRRELPQLSDLTTTILRVHGASHGDVLAKVHRLFHTLKLEVDQHLIQEEEIVFPLLKEYAENPAPGQLDKITDLNGGLIEVHEGAGGILKELRKVTDQYKLPDDACRTYMMTYTKLEGLESDLFQHIHLENNLLFPRFEG